MSEPTGTEPTGTEVVIEVVESRLPDGYGFNLKVRPSGRLFRVEPVRDPRQPRFWCLRVYRCASVGTPDPTERPWFGGGGMTREELPGVVETIRADVNAWLAQDDNRPLREWILAAGALAVAPPLGGLGGAGRTAPGLVGATERAAP